MSVATPTTTSSTSDSFYQPINDASMIMVMNRRGEIEVLLFLYVHQYILLYFLYKYIFHYKYVASAGIYFECGWRLPKNDGNGKKSDDGGSLFIM